MQSNCPNCAQRIVIDDAKVPDRAFSVKCPKCQTVVRFPGKGAAAAAPAAAPAAPEPAPEAAPSEEARAQMMAQLRRELSLGEGGRPAGRAMVGLGDRALAGSIALPLTRLGYQVDTVENPEEGARLLEQGVYDLVVTSRAAAAGGRESLYQRINRLSPEGRRRIFLVLVGDEFKTGDGTQAWSVMADLVVAARDVGTADTVLLSTLAERTRLYQAFIDARKRQESASA